jgi:two-component system, response regulator YesN
VLMYKVILVDDEKSICEGLQRMIQWEQYGFEVCDAARNGEEALCKIKMHIPDLIVTDIRMPYMNGLQLIEHVRNSDFRDMEFIVLSGYAEFEYARQAIKNGVTSYLLKPVDEDELYALLENIRAKIDQKNGQNRMKKQFLLQSLASNTQVSENENGNDWIEQEARDGVWYVLIKERTQATWLCKEGKGQISDPGMSFCQGICEFLGEQQSFVIKQREDSCELIVSDGILQLYCHSIYKFALSALDFFKRNQIVVDILIGDRVTSFVELRKSQKSIEHRKDTSFYSNKEHAIYMEDVSSSFSTELGELKQDALLKAIQEADEGGITNYINTLIRYFIEKSVQPQLVRLSIDDLLASIVRMVIKLGDMDHDLLDMYEQSKKVFADLGILQLENLLTEISMKTASILKRYEEKTAAGVIGMVMDYIRLHYQENLDIKSVSQKFHFNPIYFGQQFKKSVGVTFNQYLTILRIDEAKKLLSKTERRIYEIAQTVGFEDSNYFMIKFKDIVGMTPSDYREKNSATRTKMIL